MSNRDGLKKKMESVMDQINDDEMTPHVECNQQ
jgi:hypothetical protein